MKNNVRAALLEKRKLRTKEKLKAIWVQEKIREGEGRKENAR